ncbi:hypothetical protein [Legionella tucsonensis]|uniref:Ankyrin repeat-containing protein n=1 Tax=Legionella tucsonensis TaxID=40335 RepID=A0A0W0ZX54_9GAMM|nr:hypothetical protein [Legionella tucsonensis]KTD73642.1 ankyrin repeat-containing protein [Legionella tucsonensis]
MPNQGKIINAVNLCIKQKNNIDFELNKKGVCSALAALYIKYTLENKTSLFFYLLDQLASLPSTYRFGDNHAIDNFIIKIEKTFNAEEFSNYEILQTDLEKLLDIREKPLRNEFNLGLNTNETHWKEIFKKIGRNNRSYYISSKTHAIALTFQNGKYSYTIYDPNYNRRTKEFETVDELIKEIKECFDYKNDSFGLIIRTFAHPHATPEHYPSHDELHQIAFADQTNIDSSFYAALAKDIDTVKYLFKHNKIDYDNLGKEYFRSEFNDFLLQQPKSPILKNAILRGIRATLYVGNHKEAEKLIDHYIQTYITAEEQDELKNALQELLDEPVSKHLLLMKKEADHSKLLKLLEQLNLSQEPQNQTAYNHLQFLTFVKQEVKPLSKEQFLSKISPEQIIKQIQCAAITNQHHVLNLLISQLATAKIAPKSFPSIFTKELIEEVNSTTLKRLLENGFTVDTQALDLLPLCMQRHDKTIFETYARALAEQTDPTLWEHIDQFQYDLIDLSTSLGSTTLLNALIFLRKNNHVKNAWKDNITEEMIKSALTIAILNGNQEMCLFLQEKLKAKKSHLESDTLEFLYHKGLEEEDISILSVLTQLNFNVLYNIKDIHALFMLCFEYDDYSIIERCFTKASPKIKQLLLEYSLNWNIGPVITLCIQKEPQLYNVYLNDSITNLGKLTKLNRVINTHSLPPDTLSLNLDISEQKKAIKDCFKNKLLNLAKILCNKVAWGEDELDNFLDELILEKNENGIICLLQNFPELKQKPKLVPMLTQNNLLKPIDFLLAKDQIAIEQELSEQIFASALANNYKNLIARFLKLGRITPDTQFKQPLVELLKQAILQGYDSVLEPFIESSLNFGLDFKELFLFSCAQKQAKIANLLLTKEFILSPTEKQSAIQQLFDDQSASELFDTVYAQGYGRLYQLLLKTNVQNPRASLLRSIKNREHDPLFQNTTLYLNPLKRAIKEKNEKIFDTLFAQSNLPSGPDESIINFLKDPVLFASIFPLFEKKYGLKKLLDEAFKQKEWATFANLIENKVWNDLDSDIKLHVEEHGIDIIKAYLENLEAHYDKTDVRPQLFKLLANTNTHILVQLAIPYREDIQKTLERIEFNMLEKQLDLNNQIYRYTFNSLPYKQALEELGKIFEECQKIITEQKIDLEQAIESLEIVNHLAQIKSVMAGQDISPDYLSEEHAGILEKLIENPRFKQVCQLEFKLYCLLRQFKKPLSEQSEETQKKLNTTIELLRETLIQANLPESFVLPQIRGYFPPPPSESSPTLQEKEPSPSISVATQSRLVALKKGCTAALNYYLQHRDHTLSLFSYFFDYYRGQTRAQHYKNLIKLAQTEQEVFLIEYAILVNDDGAQLKKDLASQLKFKDEYTAKKDLQEVIRNSYTVEELPYLDELIDSINQKINENDTTATRTLFRDELTYLKKINNPKSRLSNHSFFHTKKQDSDTDFWQWIVNWLGFGYNSSSTEENRLSLRQ